MKKSLVLVLAIIGLMVSCDKDYNTIGSEILGDGNYDFEKYLVEHIKAYSRPTGSVQSNNLPMNALGVYTDTNPEFGVSSAHFVTDLQLERSAPDFGYDIDIQSNDSVYIYIPYFYDSSEVDTDAEGNRTFNKLDSIYGDLDSSINLKIYHNDYYLRNYDAVDPTVPQKYYSDEKGLIESNLGVQLNNSSNLSENDEFKFSSNEIRFYKSDGNGNFLDESGVVTTDPNEKVVKNRLEPGLWINLDKTFFLNEVLNASATDLLNNNNFKEHLKGIYFQVTQNTGEEGAMAMLDFSKGYINIQYHSKNEDTAESPLEKKSFKLLLRGNTVNFFDNNFTISSTDNDEELYLRGGDGSIVFIDLFGPDSPSDDDDVADELQGLRDENILINDAILTFTIKQENIQGKEPTRIYVFDASNNTTIVDYTFDTSTLANSKYNKFQFGGFIKLDENDRGVKYSIRITSHINKIINGNDSETNKNIVLGVSLTDNINVPTLRYLKNTTNIPLDVPNGSIEDFEFVPQSSIITPLGTTLYGTQPSVDEENRVKLEIYYTKPN